MTEILLGAWGFVKVALLVLLIAEISIAIEEFLTSRLELRRGFAAAKTTPLRVFARHGLKILRTEGTFSQHFAAALKFLIVFLAAGLLPIWSGDVPLPCLHSFWIFTTLVILGPVFHLILDWAIKGGSG